MVLYQIDGNFMDSARLFTDKDHVVIRIRLKDEQQCKTLQFSVVSYFMPFLT